MLSRLFGSLWAAPEEKKTPLLQFSAKPTEYQSGVAVKLTIAGEKTNSEINFVIPVADFEAKKDEMLKGFELTGLMEEQLRDAREQCDKHDEDETIGLASLGM